MTKANDLASLLDANGDVVSSALDNVPASDLVNDTTPQLGGNLDLNSNNITGTGNLDVTGTGTMDRLGLGAAAHASAALLLTTTNQHIRLDNSGELGVIELESNGDLNIWAHGDGETINLKTGSGAGADVLSVVGNNVGINTVSPETVLHTETNTGDTAIFNNSVAGLSIVASRNTSTSGIPALALRSWSTWTSPKDTGQIRFDGLTSTGAYTEYGHIYLTSSTNTSTGAASIMKFGVSDGTGPATERLRILPTGGITFNGDTSTNNALSDYEVGSWTPRLRGSTGEPATLITGTGTYTKVGRLVTVTFAFSSISTTGYTGTLSVDQLTFSPSASFMAGGNAMLNLIATYPSGTSNICPYITQSSSSILFYGSETQAGWTSLTHNAGAAGRYLIGSVTYEAT